MHRFISLDVIHKILKIFQWSVLFSCILRKNNLLLQMKNSVIIVVHTLSDTTVFYLTVNLYWSCWFNRCVLHGNRDGCMCKIQAHTKKKKYFRFEWSVNVNIAKCSFLLSEVEEWTVPWIQDAQRKHNAWKPAI